MMNQPPPPPPMTTSSILGNPPPNLMINFPMQVSSSLLGTAPQMHSPGSFTPGRVVPSPAVATPPQPPPPPPPPSGPPLLGNQPSILGNPPPPFQYIPMMPQSMGPVPTNRPQNSSGFSGHQFDSAMPGPVHLGPGAGYSQPGGPIGQPFPPTPQQIITTRDQFSASGGEQYANTLIHAPPGLMAVNQENHGAFSVYPMGKMETAAASAVSSSWPQYTNTGTHTSTWNFCFVNVEIFAVAL